MMKRRRLRRSGHRRTRTNQPGWGCVSSDVLLEKLCHPRGKDTKRCGKPIVSTGK